MLATENTHNIPQNTGKQAEHTPNNAGKPAEHTPTCRNTSGTYQEHAGKQAHTPKQAGQLLILAGDLSFGHLHARAPREAGGAESPGGTHTVI